MLIGVISDTHDNLPMIARACGLFAARGVEAMLHAGDLVSPFAMRLLMKAGIPLTAVFGNNDGEKDGLRKIFSNIHEPPHRLVLGGRAVLLAHDPALLGDAERAAADLVVHGHTHEVRVVPGHPLILNPGEAGGWLTGRCTAAIVDLNDMRAEIVELGSQETVKL